MPFHSSSVDGDQFFLRLIVRWHWREGLRLELVPTLHSRRTRFCNKHRARTELIDSSIDGIRRRSETIAQEQIQGNRIDFGFLTIARANRANLRTEEQYTILELVIDQLDTKCIASQHQTFPPYVPNRQSEHAVEVLEHLCSPLLISVDDDFSIGLRPKTVAIAFKFLP